MERFTLRSTWKQPAPKAPMAFKEGDFYHGAPVRPTRFFDQVSYVGDEFVGCFVIETTEGLVLLDATYPQQSDVEVIEGGLRELGLDPKNIRAILITHGHVDHYGPAKYFMERYGAVPYMSETDYRLCSSICENDADRINYPFEAIDFEVKNFLKNGDVFTLGDTSVHILETPGHTPGCLSFFFNVTDEGKPHMASLWGGSGSPLPLCKDLDRRLRWFGKWVESSERFAEMSEYLNVEVPVQVHFGAVNGLERLAICRKPAPYTANPFVFGREACREYERGLREKAVELMHGVQARRAAQESK